MSYVDEDLGLEERRAALRDYGFVCACPRCAEEAAAAAAAAAAADSEAGGDGGAQ